ncbi:MAG: hypothetical protein M3P98_02030 [bacterium]|nr:hypothetical protein [bacterium]
MIKRLLRSINNNVQQDSISKLKRKLMLHEAQVGGKLFGPIPEGHTREFFCLDSRTWVWHEEWKDQNGRQQIMTTRYDVRPDGVLKSQNGNHYKQLDVIEVKRLIEAANLYKEAVDQEVYAYV